MNCLGAGVYRSSVLNRREIMRKIPWLAVAILVGAVAGAPNYAAAIEGGSPAAPQTTTQQPPSTTGTKKAAKKSKKSSAIEDFYKGWHQAYALIYDKADYVGQPGQTRQCKIEGDRRVRSDDPLDRGV